jgi:hypothetical protein
MKTSVIGFLVLAMAGTNGGAQGPDPELGKLKGTWIASGVWHNGQRKMDLFETHIQSMLLFHGKDNAQFLGGQLGAPEGFAWRENMKVRALPKQKQLVFSFAANETKGKQKAVVSCSYTLKEGDTADELLLNFEEGENAEKWTFSRAKPGNPAPAPQPPAKKEKTTLEGAGDKDKVKTVCKRAEFSGLELEACVPEQSNAGSEIICTVTATNKSKKPITYSKQGANVVESHLRHFLWEVKDAQEKVVPTTRYGKMVFEEFDLKFVERALMPGQSIKMVTFNLTRVFDLSVAGEYSLTISTRSFGPEGEKISVDAVRFTVRGD